MDVIGSNATNIRFIPSAFLSRIMAAYYLHLCTSGLMKFTYKYHADTGMLCKGACFLACSSISPIYVARPGFTFKAWEQTTRLLLIWPRFSSWPLIKSPALFAIQAGGIALLLCSAFTCHFPPLPDREIRPPEVEERERCDEKHEDPPRFSLPPLFLTTGTDLYFNESLTAETRVVEEGHRGSRERPLIPIWLTRTATGDDNALVQVFDPLD